MTVDDPSENYFDFLNTTVNSRTKNIPLYLPKLKLKYGRRSIKCLGAEIFDDLPIEVRKYCKEKKSTSILSTYF